MLRARKRRLNDDAKIRHPRHRQPLLCFGLHQSRHIIDDSTQPGRCHHIYPAFEPLELKADPRTPEGKPECRQAKVSPEMKQASGESILQFKNA
jgi:hypothetical protein